MSSRVLLTRTKKQTLMSARMLSLADQPREAVADDLDPLDREIHLIGPVHDGINPDAGSGGGLQPARTRTDNRFLRPDLPITPDQHD